MAANQILPFGQGGGANVLDQASYAADAQRPLGNQPGTARASFVNKALLQLSAIAAGVGQFLADKQAADVTDALTAAQFSTMWQNAVKAATGGMASIIGANSAGTLTAAAANCLVAISGTSFTLTLPTAASVKAGDVLRFRCAQSGNVVLSRQSADVIACGNGMDALTTMNLRNGDGLLLVSDGASKWYAVEGSAAIYNMAQQSQRGPAAYQTGATSYAVTAGGVLVQTGITTLAIGPSVGTVSLPLAFPSSAWCVVASGYGTTFNPANNPDFGATLNLTQVTIQSMYTASTASVAWIAAGV